MKSNSEREQAKRETTKKNGIVLNILIISLIVSIISILISNLSILISNISIIISKVSIIIHGSAPLRKPEILGMPTMC